MVSAIAGLVALGLFSLGEGASEGKGKMERRGRSRVHLPTTVGDWAGGKWIGAVGAAMAKH